MEFKVIHPKPFLYHFRDPLGVCFSIILGSKLSLVVDTGYGIYDTKEIVEKYLNTPYMVINTHGHMDHTAGNFRFNEVFVPEKDYELFLEHNNPKKRANNILEAKLQNILPENFDEQKYINESTNQTKIIKENTIIDLGNMHVELIPMEGHTHGSIGLLIKEEKLLLTGDAAIHAIWLFLKESTDRMTYINMLKRVRTLDFDEFITGHLMKIYPKKYFDYYIEVAEKANINNSNPIKFKNFERPNTYEYAEMFGEDRIAIDYQEPKTNE